MKSDLWIDYYACLVECVNCLSKINQICSKPLKFWTGRFTPSNLLSCVRTMSDHIFPLNNFRVTFFASIFVKPRDFSHNSNIFLQKQNIWVSWRDQTNRTGKIDQILFNQIQNQIIIKYLSNKIWYFKFDQYRLKLKIQGLF